MLRRRSPGKKVGGRRQRTAVGAMPMRFNAMCVTSLFWRGQSNLRNGRAIGQMNRIVRFASLVYSMLLRPHAVGLFFGSSQREGKAPRQFSRRIRQHKHEPSFGDPSLGSCELPCDRRCDSLCRKACPMHRCSDCFVLTPQLLLCGSCDHFGPMHQRNGRLH